MAVPINTAVVGMIKQIEAGTREMGPANLDDIVFKGVSPSAKIEIEIGIGIGIGSGKVMLTLIFDSDFDPDPDLEINFHETRKLN